MRIGNTFKSLYAKAVRIRYLPYYRSAMPLLSDVNRLDECIENVRVLAQSDGSDKKFHIVSRQLNNVGLYTIVSYFFSGAIVALSKGEIPVFDMQTYPSIYLPKEKTGKVNAWEYYFKQPFGYGLEDVLNGSYKYTRSHPTVAIKHVLDLPPKFETGQKGLTPLWELLYKNFFILSADASKYVETEYNRIIKPGMRVLGVFCRGTDYTSRKNKDHFIQPELSDVVNKVKEVIDKWNCDYIYITSEERSVVRAFEAEFPGRVLTVAQEYYDSTDADFAREDVGTIRFGRDNDEYLKGMEYLTSVIVFSRCTSAVMGLANGSISALYLNGGKYENLHVFDMGKY